MSEREVSDWLLAHDPASSVPSGGFHPRRARAVARTMRHPLLGWLWLHHRAVARAFALIALALVLWALSFLRAPDRRTLPPVAISLQAPTPTAAPELEVPLQDDSAADLPPPPEFTPPAPDDPLSANERPQETSTK